MWRGLDDMAISPFLLASSPTASSTISSIVRCILLGSSAFESRLSIIESGCRYYTRVYGNCALSAIFFGKNEFLAIFFWGLKSATSWPPESGFMPLCKLRFSPTNSEKISKTDFVCTGCEFVQPQFWEFASGHEHTAAQPSYPFINKILCISI